jgi:hypothetical protein
MALTNASDISCCRTHAFPLLDGLQLNAFFGIDSSRAKDLPLAVGVKGLEPDVLPLGLTFGDSSKSTCCGKMGTQRLRFRFWKSFGTDPGKRTDFEGSNVIEKSW